MTDVQKAQITQRRSQGQSYGEIAEALGIPKETVKSFCRRSGISVLTNDATAVTPPAVPVSAMPTTPVPPVAPKEEAVPAFPIVPTSGTNSCRACGAPLVQMPGKKRRVFCSSQCRTSWWSHNQDKIRSKESVSHICPECGRVFTAYKSKRRKYCSHECYITARFGVRGE